MNALANNPMHPGLYAEALQLAVDNHAKSLDWLVIAHNDSDMLHRVSQVTGPSSGVLELPQSQWDFESQDLVSAIDWSINRASAKHLLLVGHSEGCEASPTQEDLPPKPQNRLLHDARKVVVNAQAAKAQFAESAVAISDLKLVQQAIVAGRLQTHFLFYLAHCGTFLLFNPTDKTFRPLA